MDVPSLIEFLRDMAAGAWGPVIVAFLLEHIPWFQNLGSETKKWTTLALFVVLPILAQVALQYIPSDVFASLEPFWSALALGFIGWLGSQVAHHWDKRRKLPY